MLVLGLGSNIGDRLANLRKTLHALQQLPDISVLQVSPVYLSDAMLPENAPADWDTPYLNVALRCETTLAPLALLKLLKDIEHSIGRKPVERHWGPRIIDIDILVWDDMLLESEQLTIPHKNLQQRPFALWPLADVAPAWLYPVTGSDQDKPAAQLVEIWGSRFSGDAPFHTRQINQRIDTPQLVGIINVTPDSFSDGGKFFSTEAAVQQAISLVAAGADVLDIGAESTAPTSTALDAETEWQRLAPVLQAVMAAKNKFIIPAKISVDTRHAATAAKALALGVDWINDVTGLDDAAMRDVIANATCDCVIMHHVSIPASGKHILPRNQDAASLVYEWGARRLDELVKSGIKRERMIFDPGVGFGKAPEQSLLLVKQCEIFNSLDTRVLIGHSRKLFYSLISPVTAAERDIETLTTTLYLATQPVDYLRIHNIELNARALRTMAALLP